MKLLRHFLLVTIHICILAVTATLSHAQQVQVTGEPGSPSGTTTILGNQLPPPPPKFGGVIKEEAKDSKPWWPPQVVPPKGAPNVLLIMTDDSGYGVPSTFGGVIPMPALDLFVLKCASVMSIHSCSLGAPILLGQANALGKQPAPKAPAATPPCDKIKAIGQWNTA